jgi:pyruvate ferredoxin oxidoreductase gamma subunit
MLNGGTIDALTHSTRDRDNRLAGRGRVPEFHAESCNSCGICLTVCSDPGGLLWREGRMVGIDEHFCKGCMRCVEVCPETKKGKALTFIPNASEGD